MCASMCFSRLNGSTRMPLCTISRLSLPVPTASTWCNSAFRPVRQHFLCTKHAYTYAVISSATSYNGRRHGTPYLMQNSIINWRNKRAVVISQFDVLKYSQFSYAIKSYFSSAFTCSGSIPLQAAISRSSAWIRLRCSGLILLPSVKSISQCVIRLLSRYVFSNGT